MRLEMVAGWLVVAAAAADRYRSEEERMVDGLELEIEKRRQYCRRRDARVSI